MCVSGVPECTSAREWCWCYLSVPRPHGVYLERHHRRKVVHSLSSNTMAKTIYTQPCTACVPHSMGGRGRVAGHTLKCSFWACKKELLILISKRTSLRAARHA